MRIAPGTAIEYLNDVIAEFRNFESIASQVQPCPGEAPQLPGLDVHGLMRPLNGVVGGDHIVYVDFNRRFDLDARVRRAEAEGKGDIARELARNRERAGILLADVSGHRLTDAVLTAMLHQAFLVGVQYELELHGKITTSLFENINTRFYQSTSVGKYLTMIYAEITSSGALSFISAAHPYPLVFSNEFDRFVDIAEENLVRFPPIGTMPERDNVDGSRHGESPLGEKAPYTLNELRLMGQGDILILFTDGFAEHGGPDGDPYCGGRLEETLRRIKHRSAEEMSRQILDEMLSFGEPEDDLSFVIIKKTA